jgi:tRNA_anti-like
LRNRIILGLFVALLIAGLWAYKEYNRKPADIKSEKADLSITAVELLQRYNKNSAAADSAFVDKIVEVSGSIKQIEQTSDSSATIYLGVASLENNVSCLLQASETAKAKNFKQGDSVSLRGVCTGFLMDVELNRCVVVYP